MRSSSPPTDPPPPPSAPTPYRFSFVALSLSCASAAVAETVTYPIDAVKTQLQLQSSAATKPKSALQLARQLGVCGLSAGLSPAVLRHVFYSGEVAATPLRFTYYTVQQSEGCGWRMRRGKRCCKHTHPLSSRCLPAYEMQAHASPCTSSSGHHTQRILTSSSHNSSSKMQQQQMPAAAAGQQAVPAVTACCQSWCLG